MLYNVLLIVQIVVSASVIILILMQQGKGADAGAAFGSGASGTVFGAQGSANFLSRTTAILATVFFLNSMGLAFLASGRTVESISIMDSAKTTQIEEAPAKPIMQSGDVPVAPSAQTGDVPAAPKAETSASVKIETKSEKVDEKPVQNSK